MAKHLATYGSVGMWGRRVGTGYAYTPRAVRGIMGRPWFRFRNDECARQCREEWAKPAPTEGDYFTVADEAPEAATHTRVDSDLRKCSLAQWEGEIIPFGMGKGLHQIGDTDCYQWLEKHSDYCWYPVGRVIKLNDAGRALRASLTPELEEV